MLSPNFFGLPGVGIIVFTSSQSATVCCERIVRTRSHGGVKVEAQPHHDARVSRSCCAAATTDDMNPQL